MNYLLKGCPESERSKHGRFPHPQNYLKEIGGLMLQNLVFFSFSPLFFPFHPKSRISIPTKSHNSHVSKNESIFLPRFKNIASQITIL